MTNFSFKSPNVTIFGGTGFLGSSLATRLVKLGYNVLIFDNNIRGSTKKIKEIIDDHILISPP